MKYALMLAIVIMLIAATGQTHDACGESGFERAARQEAEMESRRRHDELIDAIERGNYYDR